MWPRNRRCCSMPQTFRISCVSCPQRFAQRWMNVGSLTSWRLTAALLFLNLSSAYSHILIAAGARLKYFQFIASHITLDCQHTLLTKLRSQHVHTVIHTYAFKLGLSGACRGEDRMHCRCMHAYASLFNAISCSRYRPLHIDTSLSLSTDCIVALGIHQSLLCCSYVVMESDRQMLPNFMSKHMQQHCQQAWQQMRLSIWLIGWSYLSCKHTKSCTLM